MAKYKAYNYRQNVLLTVDFQKQLVPGTLEYTIHTLVEERMDTAIFDQNYKNDETGCTAYDPKVLLKIILYAYSRGLISSRQIEQACRENVMFMALSCGQRFDHSTIASFVTSMRNQIMPLFCNVLLICHEMDLLGGTVFALDGCKLPSNASKQWSGTIKQLKKKRGKMEQKIKSLLQAHIKADKENLDRSWEDRRKRQKKRLEKKAAYIDKWLKDKEPKMGARGKEIMSNITDNDSCKMKTSHGTIQGYNAQSLVDEKHQVIVHAQAFGNGQDHGNLPPMIDAARDNLKHIGYCDPFDQKIFLTDSGYHSKKSLQKCEEENMDAYIPDIHFRKRDERFATQCQYKGKQNRRFTIQDFHYDEEKDHYICKNEKVLKLRARAAKVRGNIERRYEASKKDCQLCPFRSQCLLTKKTKRKNLCIRQCGEPVNLSKKMREKIDTEEGRRIYGKRLGIVEPVFANIRHNKRLDRFTLRGKIKVNIQWVLYCMVHNMEKIAHYGYA